MNETRIVPVVKMRVENADMINANTALNDALNEASTSKEQLEKILQLGEQFKSLSESTTLTYIEEKKVFVVKDFIGIEIFEPTDDKIKKEYLATVDRVGKSLHKLVKNLYRENPQLSYQLVIEGTAAIKFEQLRSHTYNPDDEGMYRLSYRRALALYRRWRNLGLNFRNYNTEVLICGSGFNGINRDMEKEDNNKRFVIQIIPKISRPAEY